MAWHGELASFEPIAAPTVREPRRRALAARDQLARLHAQLVARPGETHAELSGAIEAASAAAESARRRELATVHHDASPTIAWRSVAACPPPMLPQLDRTRSTEATRRLRDYRPEPLGLVDRRTAMTAELSRLVLAEQTEHDEDMQRWRAQMHGWSAWCSLTARILRGDLGAYRAAIDASGCLDEIHEVLEPSALAIELATGSARIEIEIDADRLGTAYALAAPLRVARELLAVLPIAHAIVRLYAPVDAARNLLQIGRSPDAQPDWVQLSPQDAIAWLSAGRFTPGGWRATYG